MNTEEYSEGIYADQKFARNWITWVENLKEGDVRTEAVYPFLSKWIASNSPRKVLEIGSGQGTCSEHVEFGTAEYIGVEPSAELRTRARALYPHRAFLPGKAEALPIPDESVDAAFSMFVWFHIQDLKQAAYELARVLQKDGPFVVVTANPAAYDTWISWHKNAKIEGNVLRGDMERLPNDVMFLHSIEEIRKSLTESGLILTQEISCGFRQNELGCAVIICGHKA